MHRPALVLALALGLLLLPSLPVGATTLVRWDVLELTRRSEAVVQGRVLRVTPRWSADGMRILTDVDVAVESVWKGSVNDQVRIVQLGGRIDDVGQRVNGVAAFQPGEEVVVFLGAQPGSPPGERFELTGMAQGKYRVDESKGALAVPESFAEVSLVNEKTHQKAAPPAAVPLEVLRSQVRAVMGARGSP